MVQPVVPKEPIDVSEWIRDVEFPYYPIGTREKELLVCPGNIDQSGLIPGHRYLFKRSFHRYIDQFWAEVMAYHVGELIGVKVPPAWPAINSETGECAALIEWFMDYSGNNYKSLVHGGEFLQGIIKNFDREKGTHHNFEDVIKIFRVFSLEQLINFEWEKWWAETFTFDALIGNTDRHQDNWGFLVDSSGNYRFEMAPLFDNGTSLGHEILPENFHKFRGAKLQNYIQKGSHHIKWSLNDTQKKSHCQMLQLFVQRWPEYKPYILNMLDFDNDQLRTIFEELSNIQMPVPLNQERRVFVLKLIMARQEILKKTLSIE